MWQVKVIGDARKRLKKFPRFAQKRIFNSLEDLRKNPFVLGIIKLEGSENNWRLRVGSYRITLELFPKGKAIFVYKIARRTSTTY